jgi:glucokinase
LALSIDIGGTNIKYGLISQDGQCDEFHFIASEAHKDSTFLISKLYAIVDHMIHTAALKSASIKAVVIGSPGIIDTKKKVLVGKSPNFKNWSNINFPALFSEKYPIPLILENDANLAAMGEFYYSTIKNDAIQNSVFLTFGTGIGGGLILNRKLFRGEYYQAGEFGHTTIMYHGRKCHCGKRGCWERYASGSALKFDYLKYFQKNYSVKQILDNCLSETVEFREFKFLDDYLTYIALGLYNIIYFIDPKLIILGGGVFEINDKLIVKLIEKCNEVVGEHIMKNRIIKKAEFGNKAAIYGGAYLAFHNEDY